MTDDPTITVIIPTTGTRNELLKRAVESCFGGMPEGSVEVVVVGNGPSGTDAMKALAGSDQGSIVWFQLVEPNVCAARNLGIAHARGQFIRFLDDDDYLYPTEASIQNQRALQCRPDICSAIVESCGEEVQAVSAYVPQGDDLTADVLRQRGATLTLAHLIKREFIGEARWDESLSYHDDMDWMHRLATRSAVDWLPIQDHVGVWWHHAGERLSRPRDLDSTDAHLRSGVEIVLRSLHALEEMGTLSDGRREAGARAIWDYAHQGFRHSPRYWHGMAARARSLDPLSRPANPRFHAPPLRWMNPLLAEWLLFPLRAATRSFIR